MTEAERAIEAIEKLQVPQGRHAGELIHLADFQRQFVTGALAEGVNVGVLSIARGNGKSALAAALAVTHLIGAWGAQAQREIVIAARTADQASIAFRYALTLFESLPAEVRGDYSTRQHPHFLLTVNDDDGPHTLRAISADGKSALGGSPTLVLMDERAAWRPGRGLEMESALMTSIGKRQGRALIISTSAQDDANDFSRWLDAPPVGCYTQEHRPAPGLPADDLESLLIANPGAEAGIGTPIKLLLRSAQQAEQRGGPALSAFRNLVRNERTAADTRQVLVALDDWLRCTVDTLPPREGPVIIGLDLGSSASMTASAFYWPQTQRLEVKGFFPQHPSLLERGNNDRVGDIYEQMREDGDLFLLGDRTVPIRAWIAATIDFAGESRIDAIVCDRFKRAEFLEGLAAEDVKARIVFFGQGYRDGAESVRRFQRYVLTRQIKATKSRLLMTALSNCALSFDPAGNAKINKINSNSRIDAASATVLAISEASRMAAVPVRRARWALA